jgi:serine/threonine protein kinase
MDIRPGTILEGPDHKTITIESLLGRGGLGQVFKGRLSDATQVAVKTVLTALLDDDELKALQNEAQHAIGINHPNVVRVMYVNDGEATVGSPPYIVMEYVDGGTLRAVTDTHQKARTNFSVDQLRAMYLQIASGMEAVNARIVHRDLKPENVLVDAGSGGILKIADFGLAKLVDAATRSITFKGWGTRPYQAPEAFENGPNTPAMDMYAAGVMFYELATLGLPITPKPGDLGPMAWRNAHLLSAPKDIRVVRPDLPIDLAQLVMLMLQKNPSKRPDSWVTAAARLKGNRSAPDGPDVSVLVNKATSTLVKATENEARAREAREREVERTALLEQAFAEPIDVLRSLVEAFNSASSIGKLQFRQSGPLKAEINSQPGHSRVVLEGRVLPDLDLRYDGLIRVIGIAVVEPKPRPQSRADASRDRESFGGFNVVYRVRTASERFGYWSQFRFEINPLMPHATFPRWFAIDFHDLPHELQVIRAVGQYQHEEKPLDEMWFKALLIQVL